MALKDAFKNRFNIFMNNRDPTGSQPATVSATYYYRPDRVRFSRGNEKSIVTSVYNRIAMDAAAIDIKHVRLDDKGRYASDIESTINDRLSLEANIDQTGRALMQDVYVSMFDEGCVAIVPVDTDIDPEETESYKILSLRTGRVVAWYPDSVKVTVYNERTGKKEDVIMHKSKVALIENPFYPVMNEPNSTMQRLIRKLNLLDAIDEQSGSGKLDLIIQLPYTVRGEVKKQQADERLHKIEDQLKGPYGIAYTDATERITQLNRPVENNLMKQIEYLTSMLYSQLGLTQSILDGTADEKTMTNYYTRTIEPVVSAVVDEMKRKFLSKTARTQKQSIVFFRDPFKLVSITELAELADKFTRNEIMTSNEIRQKIGMQPSDDPKADELRNSNINQTDEPPSRAPMITKEQEEIQNGES